MSLEPACKRSLGRSRRNGNCSARLRGGYGEIQIRPSRAPCAASVRASERNGGAAMTACAADELGQHQLRLKIPRASARAGAASPAAEFCHGEVRRCSVASSSPSRRTETGEARAPVSPTPSGVDWAGNAEMRCTHRSSTRAGPFDAVIDVVRSRRLMRGARLLLLPALRFLCALLRCLRRLPSLLRHAALLAMSEWRHRPVPAGIASTALALLQRDKKTSVFT